jgi:hypothetical protein
MDKQTYKRLAAHELHEATDSTPLNTTIDNSEYERLERENTELKRKCAEYETILGIRLREIKAALEDDTILISRTDYNRFHVIANDLLHARGEFVEEMPLSEILDAVEQSLTERAQLVKTLDAIIAYTEWAKDVDVNDPMNDLRYPQNIVGKEIHDIAVKARKGHDHESRRR